MSQTLEQRRAGDALDKAKEAAGETSEKFKKSYRSYVERLGPAVLMNGLGQAMATERAAAGQNPTKEEEKKAHDQLYANLSSWLCRNGEAGNQGVYPGAADLLEAITGNDEFLYLRAQAEALAWLEWHKKFCRAQLPHPDHDAG